MIYIKVSKVFYTAVPHHLFTMSDPSKWPTPNYENPELAGSLEGSLATSIILGSIAVAAVSARLWSRFRILRRLGLDDMMIVIALVGLQNLLEISATYLF